MGRGSSSTRGSDLGMSCRAKRGTTSVTSRHCNRNSEWRRVWVREGERERERESFRGARDREKESFRGTREGDRAFAGQERAFVRQEKDRASAGQG